MTVLFKQSTEIISGVSFITAQVVYDSISKNQIHLNRDKTLFSLSSHPPPPPPPPPHPERTPPRVYVRAWTLCLLPQSYEYVSEGASQSYEYPNFSEGADRVGGQLCGNKECPFSGVTTSGRVWKNLPESGRLKCFPAPSSKLCQI